MLGFWYTYIGYINLATTILVPLGVLLHYMRKADRHPPVARGLSADAAAFWQLSARRVVARGRWASGCTLALALPFIYMQNAFYIDESKWITYLGPLVVVTAIIIVFLCRPAAHRVGSGDLARQIDLNQRTVWSFGRRWWFVGTLSAAAMLVLSLVAAGLASSPDENGDFTQLSVDVGSASAATELIGWYYGVPIMVAATALALAALGALWLNARTPLAVTAGERAIDVWLRNRSTRAVVALSGGALILTLAYVWSQIGGAASLGFEDGATGIKVGTPIAALSVPLIVSGQLLKGLGYALIALPFLTRSPRLTFAAPVGPRAEALPAEEPSNGAAGVTHVDSVASVERP